MARTAAPPLPRPGQAWHPARRAAWPSGLDLAFVDWPPARRRRATDAASALPGDLRRAFEQTRQALGGAGHEAAVRERCVHALRRQGLDPAATGHAMALVAHALARTTGLQPYSTQLLAAWWLLSGSFVEMATGEGKTLAMGLAAGVAALGGAAVHVLTANDYLATRDHALLAPAYDALGLRSAAITAEASPAERAAAYRLPIVHATAREIGFDHLRDHLRLGSRRDPALRRAAALAADGAALPPAEPVLPGLCVALLDEADSLLLDEATVPLLLAQPGVGPDRVAVEAAWSLSAALQDGTHYRLNAALQRAELTEEGLRHLGRQWGERPGLRRQVDLVQCALVARHLLQRDRHYALAHQGVELIDEPTGRRAAGRRWSGHLYPMVQIKEGLPPSAPAVAAAQVTYPRLFQRYPLLAGVSGTLAEARRELRATYGKPVQQVPLAHADRRCHWGTRLWLDAADRDRAVAGRVAELQRRGRPTLVGTDSVAGALALSRRLHEAGIAHQCLHAGHGGDEARLIARAGVAGCVTVTTAMGGRGTDIRLDDAARAAGGLHVLVTAFQRSRRGDRQLIGRAARQGDPGSAEALLALDDALLATAVPHGLLHLARRAAVLAGAGRPQPGGATVPAWLAAPLLAAARRQLERADAARRRQAAQAAGDADDWLGFAGLAE